jgi:hypothetical protein
LRAATPNLKTAHAGASTRKTQHLQPKASNAADAEEFCLFHIEYSLRHFAQKILKKRSGLKMVLHQL